jgi:glycosyltransferase involved in cell wall biosynthesis
MIRPQVPAASRMIRVKIGRPMNIGFDLRPSLSKPTGVGSYVLALAERLPRLAPQDRFFFFSASFKDRYPKRDWPPNVKLVDLPFPVRVLNFAWNRLGWPALDRLVGASLDLVHSPHPLLVPGGRRAKCILTVHDLFFLKHPDMTSAEIRRDYVPLVKPHARRADGVICVSDHTASETRLLLDVAPEKIVVIPNGVDPAFRQPIASDEVDRVLARHRLPRGALLYVGSDERRKNLVNLAMAYMGVARRRHRMPPLVMVGPGASWGQGGVSMGPQIRSTGYLETREIRALMAASLALVLPSLEEGFGLPVAEAMAAGLPVVCSRGSALEEVAGGAATLVNPLDAASIATGIETLLDDPEAAARQRALGLEQSRRFDWDAAAVQTLAFYRRVAGP